VKPEYAEQSIANALASGRITEEDAPFIDEFIGETAPDERQCLPLAFPTRHVILPLPLSQDCRGCGDALNGYLVD
jgi:hypothetical protein